MQGRGAHLICHNGVNVDLRSHGGWQACRPSRLAAWEGRNFGFGCAKCEAPVTPKQRRPEGSGPRFHLPAFRLSQRRSAVFTDNVDL